MSDWTWADAIDNAAIMGFITLCFVFLRRAFG
jgi:hypothetical protein